jgi:hypothetical protein
MPTDSDSTTTTRANVEPLCIECAKDAGDQCFECDFCGCWIHFACCAANKDTVSAISGNSFFLVACKLCQANIRKKQRENVESGNNDVNDRFTRLESQIATLAESVNTVLDSVGHRSVPSPDGVAENQTVSYSQATSRNIQGGGGRVTYAPAVEVDEDVHRKFIVVTGLDEKGDDMAVAGKLCKALDPSAIVS